MFTLIPSVGAFDDLVFEGRNRAYGAFELRRHYSQRLRQALLLTLALCLLLLLIPLALRQLAGPEVIVLSGTYRDIKLIDVLPTLPDAQAAKPAAPAAPAAAPAVTVTPHSAIATEVAPDAQVKPQDPATVALPQDVGPSGPATAGPANPEGLNKSSLVGPGIAPDTAVPAAPAAPVVLPYAEVMPSFPGGQDALRKYLQKHLRFPPGASANGVSGRVYVGFVVQADGRVTDVQVLKDLDYGTGKAAAEVVRDMPDWLPGQQNHHAVPVRFTLPITFTYE